MGGDIIEIFATGNGLTSNLLVTPASAADGALQVNTIDEGDDEVKVTLVETTSSPLPVRLQGGEGGGGGGLVRPGLVVNILASLGSAGGGTFAPVVTLNDLLHSSFIDMPAEIEQVVINFDPFIPLEPFDVTAEQFETFDFPLSIDNDGFALSGITNTIDTKTLNVGEPVKIKTVFYIPVEIEHVAFYTNMREGDTLDNSDTFLRFWKHGAEQFQLRDTNGFFEYINLTLEENGIKKIATFDMKFLKPMEKSDIVLRMWDAQLHSTTIIIFDAIEVVGPSIEQLEETSTEGLEISEPGTTLPEASELRIEEPPIAVPDWIKNTAGWWSEGVITEGDFVSGIKWLVENGIIRI